MTESLINTEKASERIVYKENYSMNQTASEKKAEYVPKTKREKEK